MVRKRSDDIPPKSLVTHLEISIYPFRDTTQAAVVLVSGHGPSASRLRLWAGYLDCSRGDLAGLDSGQVTVLLCDHLRRVLDTSADGDVPAVGPAAPLGGPGGVAYNQSALPGLDLPV
jgi:hypothetical protein